MMAPAFVACCNTARLKSPYILIFRPLCVDPISASSVAASFSEPPSLISVSTPQPFSMSFAVSLFFDQFVFFRANNSVLSSLYHQRKKREANICCRSSVQGFFAPTTTKWDHEMSKTRQNDTVFVWKGDYSHCYPALTTKDHQVCS